MLEMMAEQLPKAPDYFADLSDADIATVQQRCTAAIERQGKPNGRIDSMPVHSGGGALSRELQETIPKASGIGTSSGPTGTPSVSEWTVPPAFQFDKYDHLPLYIRSVLIREQDAVALRPQQLRGPPPDAPPEATAEPRTEPLVLHISVYSRDALRFTRKTRSLGSESIDPMKETSDMGDLDGSITLTQTIECLSHQTLADMAHEIMCVNRDVPERVDWKCEHDGAPSDKGGSGYPTYCGTMLETDTCVQLAGELYGNEDPLLTPDSSYIRALESLASASSGRDITMAGRSLRATRFTDLFCLEFGAAHWLLHMGDCEHLWSIDWARPLHAAEKEALTRSPRAQFPRTTYVQRWVMEPLARLYLAPKKVVERRELAGVPCEICAGMRRAVAVVLGGHAVQFRNGGDMRLDGFPQMVTPCCAACYRAASGEDLPDVLPSSTAPVPGRPWTIVPLPSYAADKMS
ncbi:hypothetical protein MSPP1_003116 [Malassezia sp. CBS 17886]|nr:hypothetical protein MSPP1_003116 [Malassezia sp. CBS 17886]